jgi:hypothetical protein
MTSPTLRYGEDPVTGLPRLTDPTGSLNPADLDALQRAIDQHFERLASGPETQLFTLPGVAGPDGPRHYRVTVTEREKRCPTLLLVAVPPPPEEAPAPAPDDAPPEPLSPLSGRWQGHFLAEVAEALASAREGETDGVPTRAALDFVLSDLRALLRKDPRKFTLLIFAGYLYVGDTLSLRHGASGDNRYSQAARALAQLAGGLLPNGSLAPLLSQPEVAAPPPVPAPAEARKGWLQRLFE